MATPVKSGYNDFGPNWSGPKTCLFFLLSWKQSVWRKKRHVLGTFQFGPKSLYPELTGVAIFWLILSIFWNVENTLPILLKHSKFCSFMKTICLKKKKAYFGNFSIWTKIAVSGPYRCVNFLVDFEYLLKCWNYPSNSCETFKILFFHKNNQFEEKKACFGDFSIFGKIAVSGPYRCGLFLVDFEYFLKCWKYPSHLSETFKFSLKKKKHVFGTFQFSAKSLYPDITGMAIFWLISSLFLYVENTLPNSRETFKILFQFFWNIQNLFSHENNQFEEKKGMFWGHFNLDQNRCIRTLPAWPFFGWFWVFFEMLKIPFQFFWNIQNFVLSWKQSVWSKITKFLGLFNFRQNRCVRTLPAWPFFGWFWLFFEMLKIHFQFLWNIQNFVLTFKLSLKKKTHVFGTFQFSAKSLYPDLTGVASF